MMMITGDKVSVSHILPFGCLFYVAIHKAAASQDPKFDPKFDPRAQATVYVGH